MRLAAGLSVVALLLTLSSCDSSRDAPPASEATPESTASATAPAGDPGADDVLKPVVVRATTKESVVSRASLTFTGFLDATREFLLTSVGDATGVRARATPNGDPLLVVRAGVDQTIGRVAIDGRWLVWEVVADVGKREPEIRLTIADLESNSVSAVAELPGALAPGLPSSWWLQDGVLVYTTQDGQPTNCLTKYDLRLGASTVIHCTPRKSWGTGFPNTSDWGVAFNQWAPEPVPRGCLEVLAVRSAKSDAAEVPARRSCQSFSGVVGRDFTFWGERHRPNTPEESTFYAESATGDVYELGKGETGKHAACGPYVYWVAYDGETAELRRWRPGQDIEAVYRNSDRWLTLSGPRCHDGHVTTTRFPQTSSMQELIELPLSSP